MADGFIELKEGTLDSREGISEVNRMNKLLFELAPGDGDTVRIYSGYGTPESAVAAGIGSLFLRLDGGASTTLYVKESGTGNTGWIPK